MSETDELRRENDELRGRIRAESAGPGQDTPFTFTQPVTEQPGTFRPGPDRPASADPP